MSGADQASPVVRPVTKLLIANRGEIARRVMRTARRLGIPTVAVYSDPDRDAPFVREADEAVRLPGATPAETYLDGAAIVAAATATSADAVHPGYGFLSENEGFARACAEADLVFVGPSPEAIGAMGSKLSAKELMGTAGVPVLPGASVTDPDEARATADRLGYPLLVKAAYGGGGRGMRVVRSSEEVAEAVASAGREAGAAFGDPTVFLERFVDDPRHIEVQIFGDTFGRVVHLFERECSIQRRYQKIIEEAPSPAVDPERRSALGSAAVTAARTLGYVGAGTVEFVMDQAGDFFFLEVNTRLQVEHPVTEEVTGLDLVALQLEVAGGAPLPEAVLAAGLSGHAIEARLYAEDVAAGFLPVSGTLSTVAIPAGPGVRVDSGVEDGSVVSTHYDAMLAKVVAWGETRAVAASRLADALAGARLHGLVTNRDLLVGVLRHPEFLAGHTDTGFLTRHDPAALGRRLPPAGRRLHALAAAVAGQAERRRVAPVQPAVPSGWRNVGDGFQTTTFADAEGTLEIRYRLGDRTAFELDGQPVPGATVHRASPSEVVLSTDGVRRTVAVARAGATWFLDSPLGSSTLTEAERFPLPEAAGSAGSLLAPMPGSVVRVLCAEGDIVEAGQVLVVLEAMKMEHAVRSPTAGTVVAVRVTASQQVETGAVLAVVDEGEGGPDD